METAVSNAASLSDDTLILAGIGSVCLSRSWSDDITASATGYVEVGIQVPSPSCRVRCRRWWAFV